MKVIDTQIIKACQANNRLAQKQLYGLLLPYLGVVAERYLRDPSYKKDVLQEAFVNIFRNMDRFDAAKGAFKYWAVRIVINSALNYNQRVVGKPNEEITFEHHTIAEQPTAIERLSNDELILFLKSMPADYYTVFNLFVIDGYAHEEIADSLGISKALSRKRLSRARDWIKKTGYEHPSWKLSQTSFD